MNPVQRTSGPNFPLQQTSSTAVPLVPPPLGHIPPPPPRQPPPLSGHVLPHQPVITPPNQSTHSTYQYPYQYPYSYYSATPTETHPSNLTTSQGDGLLPTPPAAIPLYVPTWAQQHQTNTTGNKTGQTSLTSSSASDQEITLSDNEPNQRKPPLNQNTDKSKTIQETNSENVKAIDNSLDDKSSFESQSDDSKPIKINFSKGFKGKRTGPTISVKLKTQTEVTKKPKLEQEVSKTVADAFGNDSEEEEEEMPREAKLRMRNIGKDTPTSSGPNSFSKSAKGFLDSYSILRKEQDWC